MSANRICIWMDTLILLCVAMFFTTTVKAQEQSRFVTKEEIKQITQRIIAAEPRLAETKLIDSYIQTMDEKGNWPDVDYVSLRRAKWPAIQHATRLRDMGLFYYDLKDSPERMNIKSKIIQGLNRWLEMKLVCPNWWPNEIGVPERLGIAALCLGDGLPDQTRDGLVSLSRKFVKIKMTGANKVWLSQNVIFRGLLAENSTDIKDGIESIQQTIYKSLDEGIQPDMSFHQHGPVLMNNSYGLSYLQNNLQFMWIFQETAYSFKPEIKLLLTEMLLDGTGLMTFKEQSAPATMGRACTRIGALKKNLSVLYRQLLECDPPRRDEAVRAIETIEGKLTYVPINKMFYAADFMIHQRPNWHLSIKMFSDRTFNSDTLVNSEGKENGYMSHGTAFLMRGHDEYYDLPGVWDWQYLPGSTVGISPKYQGKLKIHNQSSYAGGVSNGKFGAAGMQLDVDGLHAKLAWFCLNDGYLVMGSGLKHEQKLPIITTLDQCRRRTPVWTSDMKQKSIELSDEDKERSIDSSWLWHDDVVYANLGNSKMCLGPRWQVGNWGNINITHANSPDIKEEVFRAWLKHTSGQFAYAVYPDVKLEKASIMADSDNIHIIKHDENVLAIYHTIQKFGMAIFFQPSKVQFTEKIQVAVDKPVAMLLDSSNSDEFDIYVSSPNHYSGNVNIRYNDKTQTIPLPMGMYAGQSTHFKMD